MEKKTKLTLQDQRIVSRFEKLLRLRYLIEGELEGSMELIDIMEDQILDDTNHALVADVFLDTLRLDSRKINFSFVYLSGKKSFLNGEPPEVGFYRLMGEIEQKNSKLASRLRHYLDTVTSIMERRNKDLPRQLLEEYRATYGKVNQDIEIFFKLGYGMAKRETEKYPQPLGRNKTISYPVQVNGVTYRIETEDPLEILYRTFSE